MIKQCEAWLKNYVIGLRLCPFAKKPFEEGKIQWVVIDELEEMIPVIDSFLGQSYNTTLMIFPEVDHFYDFLELYRLCGDIIRKLDYKDDIELVTFHPSHQYEGTAFEDEVNFANRSPYPIIQLLRSAHLRDLGMNQEWKDEILENNQETLFHVGAEQLEKMLDEYRREN